MPVDSNSDSNSITNSIPNTLSNRLPNTLSNTNPAATISTMPPNTVNHDRNINANTSPISENDALPHAIDTTIRSHDSSDSANSSSSR